MKLRDFSLREASKLIGKEVWVIGGEFKGRRATLYAVGWVHSVVALPGYPSVSILNHHIAAS